MASVEPVDAYLGKPLGNILVAIPSLDRPDELCAGSLAFLREQGVRMPNVTVFVAPGKIKKNTETEKAPN